LPAKPERRILAVVGQPKNVRQGRGTVGRIPCR
jgi:hypothetical protein